MNINNFKIGDYVKIDVDKIRGVVHKDSPRIVKIIEIIDDDMVKIYPSVSIKFITVSNNYYSQDLLHIFLLKKITKLSIDDNLFEL